MESKSPELLIDEKDEAEKINEKLHELNVRLSRKLFFTNCFSGSINCLDCKIMDRVERKIGKPELILRTKRTAIAVCLFLRAYESAFKNALVLR
ncbi:hypothetical protein QS257_01215 [Terrilactibacillus sp. S3-3]|nr:hypothetical protein QS257_01215 [Terrilactibacillus sp. S3-3]